MIESSMPSGECPSALRNSLVLCAPTAGIKYLSWSRVRRARKFREVSIMPSITGCEGSFFVYRCTTRKILHMRRSSGNESVWSEAFGCQYIL